MTGVSGAVPATSSISARVIVIETLTWRHASWKDLGLMACVGKVHSPVHIHSCQEIRFVGYKAIQSIENNIQLSLDVNL